MRKAVIISILAIFMPISATKAQESSIYKTMNCSQFTSKREITKCNRYNKGIARIKRECAIAKTELELQACENNKNVLRDTQEILKLRAKYPSTSPQELANKIISNTQKQANVDPRTTSPTPITVRPASRASSSGRTFYGITLGESPPDCPTQRLYDRAANLEYEAIIRPIKGGPCVQYFDRTYENQEQGKVFGKAIGRRFHRIDRSANAKRGIRWTDDKEPLSPAGRTIGLVPSWNDGKIEGIKFTITERISARPEESRQLRQQVLEMLVSKLGQPTRVKEISREIKSGRIYQAQISYWNLPNIKAEYDPLNRIGFNGSGVIATGRVWIETDKGQQTRIDEERPKNPVPF